MDWLSDVEDMVAVGSMPAVDKEGKKQTIAGDKGGTTEKIAGDKGGKKQRIVGDKGGLH